MNTLISSGNNITIAQSQQYTLLDDEVAINGKIFKKNDIEISINGNNPNANQLDVKVGIVQRKGNKGTPANLENYLKWNIDGSQPSSLSNLVELINTIIQ